MKLKYKTDECINAILNEFDFEKVNSYMVANNWEYCGGEVPTIKTLRETAHNILDSVLHDKKKFCWMACGGFLVIKNKTGCYLHFAIEEKDYILDGS